MDYTTNITIFRDEFTNPILHDDEWYMMLWGYYCKCCVTITTFVMEALRSIWTIEFATIIRDATTKLRDFDVNMIFASILIYGSILVLVWNFVRFIAGLLASIATTKDMTENKESTGNMDATENTKDPIEIKGADEPLLPSLPTEAVSTPIPPSTLLSSSSSTATPPTLVSEPTGPHTVIKQLRDIRSLLKEVESKVKELESSFAEENSTTEDSTTDDSTTDDSASNDRPTVFADRGYEADESKERNDEQEPPTMAQAKANALLWQRNQVAKMKRQSRQRRQEKRGY